MSELPLQFNTDGLVPVVVQDYLTGEVRMVAYASLEAVQATLRTGRATFYSRSRGELWEKGRTSGNVIAVKRILVDCDSDCVIYSADPRGPSCHTGAQSCFFQVLEEGDLTQKNEQPQTVIASVEATLEARKKSTAKASYTKSLYDGGAELIGKKLREEADELARAIASETDERVVSEAVDVLYHLLVGLRSRGIGLRDALAVLDARLGTSGHEEKARRG